MLCALAVGLPLLAWFSRGGPGRVCRTVPPYPAVFCGDQLNPWPWITAAIVPLVVAAVLFANARSRDKRVSAGDR
jgi:hypothetical protein